MRLTRNYYDQIEIPDFILCKANGEKIGVIPCAGKKTLSINELNEITFDVYKYVDGNKNELYDLITEMKYVLLPGLFKFVITSVSENDDGVNPQKEVTAQSVETNLGQRYLEQFYINNGEDYAINDVKLYDPNDETHSLLSLVLSEKCPDWSVGYVDPDIKNSQRFFEVERTDVYTFLTNDVANAFNAVITFDSWLMKINVYKEENYGEDTNIFLTYENLLQNATLSSSVDDIKTCMTVVGADDLNLREVNMGSDRIYNFDYYATTEFMSDDLCEAYHLWKTKMAENRIRYSECVNETILLYHDINYLMNEKMPTFGDNKLVLPDTMTVTINGVTFETDVYAQKITCNGTATSDIEYILSDSLSDALELDEIYRFNGCPIQPSEETFPTPHLQDYYIIWYNKDDPATKEELTAIDKGYGNEKRYEEGYNRISILIKADTVLEDVKFIPAIYKPESECKDWDRYGLNPLKEKLAEYEGKQAVMAKAGWGDKENQNYETQYLPVYNAIQEIKAQIIVVEEELSELNNQLTEVHEEMSSIAIDCSMANNFTDDQIIELSRFIREENVNSDNYIITDSMTDEERVDMLLDMLEYGETELAKVSQPQIQFSISMVNLFNLKEFDDLSVDFDRGNYVHVILRDDYVVKAKLLSMDFDFYNMDEMSVTFGNVNQTKERTLFTDISKAINTATSVSTTVSVKGSYWNAANQDINEVNTMLEQGLVAAGQTIETSSADVKIDDNGIMLKSTDPNYPNDCILIGGSRILFSDDGMKTVREAIGRCKFIDRGGVEQDKFGVIAEFMLAGYINGTTIDASDIHVGGSSDGKIVMYDQYGIEKGRWDKDGLTLPPGTKISWTDVEDAPSIPQSTSELVNDEGFVTGEDVPAFTSQLINNSGYQTAKTIKENVITKDYLDTLGITAGQVPAEGIVGNDLKDKSIKLILDSNNVDVNSPQGVSLITRHNLGTYFDYAHAEVSETGGMTLVSRKKNNSGSTPSTQNDYTFYSLSVGNVRDESTPRIYLDKRDGHINKTYEYVDRAADNYADRRLKDNNEISNIVYDENPVHLFKIDYDGKFVSYDGSDYGQLFGTEITIHKNNKDAHACLSKNQTIHDYGSSEITNGQMATVYIDADLLAMADLTNGYQVFITNTSADLTTYVEKNSDNFVVHGTTGATFDYHVVMKQA